VTLLSFRLDYEGDIKHFQSSFALVQLYKPGRGVVATVLVLGSLGGRLVAFSQLPGGWGRGGGRGVSFVDII